MRISAAHIVDDLQRWAAFGERVDVVGLVGCERITGDVENEERRDSRERVLGSECGDVSVDIRSHHVFPRLDAVVG